MEKEEWYNKEGIITNQSIKVKNKVSSQISKYIKKYHHKLILYIYYYLVYTSIYLKSIENNALYCDDTFLGKNENEINTKKKTIEKWN